jgi:diguanylate cyclase (GGDEF)-like protein
MERLTEEFLRGKRHGYPLGLLMLDIDHFKKVNDTHGHAAGDLVLKAVAALISENVRQEDAVYRFGGEEICAILPYASTARCWNAGERLRKAVDEGTASKQASGELPCRVTISVGGASTERGLETEEELLKAADKMMYVSKESGRNRVTIAGLNEK